MATLIYNLKQNRKLAGVIPLALFVYFLPFLVQADSTLRFVKKIAFLIHN